MENILIAPYRLNARWYKFFLESDGIDRKITTKDIDEVYIDGNYLVFPEGFHIMDLVIDFNSLEASQVTSRAIDIQFGKDGLQKVFIPNADNFDYGDIYVLGHYK